MRERRFDKQLNFMVRAGDVERLRELAVDLDLEPAEAARRALRCGISTLQSARDAGEQYRPVKRAVGS